MTGSNLHPERSSHHDSSLCSCGPVFQVPLPNGTCDTCGGWLTAAERDDTPWGRQGLTLTQMWAGKEARS